MKRHDFGGLFIAFEGLDGSGSSTQVGLLVNRLRDNGYPAYETKEPTNNIVGGLIRGQLTHDWSSSMECLQLLFAADRAHHLYREILPNLNDKKIIVSDRYFFSTIAFGSLELDKKWLMSLNEKFILPDITFLIKVPPKECVRRMQSSRFELELFEQEQKLTKVWQIYHWLSVQFKNVYVLDGMQSRAQIAGEVYEITKRFLRRKNIERKESLLNLKKK
jgi:dTMP kinase